MEERIRIGKITQFNIDLCELYDFNELELAIISETLSELTRELREEQMNFFDENFHNEEKWTEHKIDYTEKI